VDGPTDELKSAIIMWQGAPVLWLVFWLTIIIHIYKQTVATSYSLLRTLLLYHVSF